MTENSPQWPDTQNEQLARFEQAVRTRSLATMRAQLEEGLTSIPPALASEALLIASLGNALATVELLLRAGADPNAQDGAGTTPLYYAAEGDQPEIARALLSKAANPNGSPIPGAAPILCAVDRGNLSVLKVLIDAKAALDVTYADGGYTLLHKATHRGYREITRHLVEAGMSIQVTDDWGDTPLHTAVSHSTSMIPTLLELGADVNAPSGNGSTPVIRAAHTGDVQAFQLLVSEGGDPLALENHGLSVFDTALRGRRPIMAAWVLKHYPTLAPKGEVLDDAFVRAVRAGCTPLVQMLAGMGADFGQKPNGRTLLQIAPSNAHELKRFLRSLKSGATIETAMSSGGDDVGTPAPASSFPTL